jgi:hypothetical protein
MKYRIKVEKANNINRFVPQWKLWILPWQNFYEKNHASYEYEAVKCSSKEMCLNYFTTPEHKDLPSFHFYCCSQY